MQNVRDLFIGTSGFASPSTRWSVPASSAAAHDLLSGYASMLPSVEMDSSFLRPPSYETVLSWRQATPEHFRFSVRVPREITHADRLRSDELLVRLCENLKPLGERLGALLFTLPADLNADVSRLHDVLGLLPQGLPTAWEFRHPSWHRPDVLDELAEHRAVPVVLETLDGVLGSRFIDAAARFPAVYVRFRKDRYRARELMAWGELLAEPLESGCDVFAYFRQSTEAMAYAIALLEVLSEAAEDMEETVGGWAAEPLRSASVNPFRTGGVTP